ncbi:bifunctional diaminohydroxyphosphoribosylaminopyrimidine deaminase/5-amino-6-(5-phosphoribosylamino)uracil reductase RibD [Sulfurospirillum sp. 1612]|uniref:bifunctional diaminohydroxyphosphoribosylaminopyrimidine deaminase/5-amino-6-(5-phosphoribosylamino)uracil reductase RibD n=1 Tax=Sulfurospirillum sp. 1612 TaxID=3094835 RepID=UPI002F95C21E
MVTPIDISLMQQAVDEAWKYQILTYPNPAVGALIVDENGAVIALGAHHQAGLPHAEVEAIKNAYFTMTHDANILGIKQSDAIHHYLLDHRHDIFKKCTIYVTLEPCHHHGKTPPCSRLIKGLGFKRVVIGQMDSNDEAHGGAAYLKAQGIGVDVLESSHACEMLSFPFRKWQQGNFVFFKLAMSANGVIDGGIITDATSRMLVHQYRTQIDLLVIGGNTVRMDRPILDSRLNHGRAPDVMIYSKKKDFDPTIPLFQVQNRRVFIEDHLERIKEYKCVMIEGGAGMLDASREFVDLYAIFRSPNFKRGHHIDLDLKLQELNSIKLEHDRLSWYQKI